MIVYLVTQQHWTTKCCVYSDIKFSSRLFLGQIKKLNKYKTKIPITSDHMLK